LVGTILLFVLLALVVVIVAMSVKIVPQQEVGVVERLGKFHKLIKPGLNVVIPVIDRVRKVLDLRIQQANVPPQTVITKDNVQVMIDTIIFYQVVNPEQATYGISDYVMGVRNISTATLRQVIGKMELDETLAGRERISAEIRVALDEATEKWGVRIERVEVLDIRPPEDIQEAMDKQMKAERSRRAIILEAEAAKQDMILRAEGQRQSAILKAEGDREARIREAEGLRQAQELEAAGRAEAIRLVAEAERQRIEQLKQAGLDENILSYKSFEALMEMAKGDANKVFIPSSALETLGSLGAMADVLKTKKGD
jgi:regulator of protease activity HflC (stomatin/prohibitin superfamily)